MVAASVSLVKLILVGSRWCVGYASPMVKGRQQAVLVSRQTSNHLFLLAAITGRVKVC
jgi:hypothetical protein